ncbi:MAG: hypothetical protein U5K54_18945 [Cytophagales bacterium]|nr:hypothetical protein [Cytophagales bacterium]
MKAFAVMAGVISIGAMAIALAVQPEKLYLIPLFMVGLFFVLAIWLFLDFKQSKLKYEKL